jgi:phage gp46-like protein
MTDIRLKEYLNPQAVTMDFLLRPTGLLDEREEFASSIRVALGTDALASASDILPDPDSTDRRGWWGDLDAEEIWSGWDIGVLNWLLSRAKITDATAQEGSTLERARRYTISALQPFIDMGAASQINVVATRTDLQEIVVDVKIYRGPLSEIALRYQVLWEEDAILEDADKVSVSTDTKIRVPFRNLTLSSTFPILSRIAPPAGQLRLSTIQPGLLPIFAPPAGQFATSRTSPSVVGSTPLLIMAPISGQLVLSPTPPTRAP